MTQSPPELLGLNQKHVRGCPSGIPRIPNAAVTVFLEFVVAKLKEPFVSAGFYARVAVTLDFGNRHHHCQAKPYNDAASPNFVARVVGPSVRFIEASFKQTTQISQGVQRQFLV